MENKKICKIDKFFGVTKAGSSIRTEIVAGIVTFLAMAYILVVNPSAILSESFAWTGAVMPTASIFLATALGAIVGTLLIALLAKMPLAQASGMGLNYMVGAILGGSLGFGVTYGNVMLLVLISGILFLLLSVLSIKGISIREMIFDAIPASVRGAISVGIGLFIAFIGMQNAGLIVSTAFTVPAGDGVAIIPGTLVDLVAFNNYTVAPYVGAGAIVCLVGFFAIAILDHFKVKGAVIIGIILATLVGIPFGVTTWSGESWAFWENFGAFFSMDPAKGGAFFAAFTEGFKWGEGVQIMALVMTVISFCMVDMFDTMGTIVGCCVPVGLADENNKPFNYNKIMYSDSIATCAGAMFGTSTVTTFVESGSGIAAGGRTGLTALSTAVCFILAIPLFPLIASIPGPAAAAALLYVGSLMLKGIKNINLDGAKNAIAGFLTIAMMPLSYSITDGIGFGIISYVLIDVITYVISAIAYACAKNKEGKEKPKFDLHPLTIIIAVLFLVYFFVPIAF